MSRTVPEYLDVAAVAEHIGVKRDTVYVYLSRGSMPEPDVTFLGRPLWLVTTIDAWRKDKHKRGRKLPARRHRPRAATPELLFDRPPRLAGERARPGPSTRRGASVRPNVNPRITSGLSEPEAKRLAAAVREAGFHCTADDVHELIGGVDEAHLEHERLLLRRRIIAKRRELRD